MSATILIVEDDAVFRELVSTILDNAGYTVATACDGGEGLRRIQRERFDLVLCDLKMPLRGGLELFRVTRGEPAAPLSLGWGEGLSGKAPRRRRRWPRASRRLL